MKRKITPPSWWPRWNKKSASSSDQSMGVALVHLGIAIKAQQDGNLLLAVRHLAMAAETITSLIEQWATPAAAEEAAGIEVEEV